MSKRRCFPALLFLSVVATSAAHSAERTLDAKLHHLRCGATREWSEFAEQAEAPELTIRFQAQVNSAEKTLRLRHIDVKQGWRVVLNGKDLGRLPRDENDIVTLLPVAAQALVAGPNELSIVPASNTSDDIRVGEVRLFDQPMDELTHMATLKLAVVDEAGEPVPCRLTIVDANGSLVPLGAKSSDTLAVRNGMVYSAAGEATCDIIPGSYTVYAGRGFEYGIDSARIDVAAGETVERCLQIRREVPTAGYVSCDTHVHTLTYSGHGDATIEERMISIAGEGLELPVATDHNVHTDYESVALRMGLRKFFTPAIGNEVSTPVGHFNVFPIERGAAPPEYRVEDWRSAFDGISSMRGVQVIVLNHARDLHGAYRPFDPRHHNAVVGENLDGWQLRANAMEVVNSAALQSDPMRLYQDWFGLLNRGLRITPIGASDSHEVARKLVAQGRTYIRCRDDDPGNLDVAEACKALQAGRVVVSMGLFVEIKVEKQFEPGDLAAIEGDVDVDVRVLGPTWVAADRVCLFANGRLVKEAAIPVSAQRSVVKWTAEWRLPKPVQDLHLVAIATGPGVSAPYWKIPKPNQPTSNDWRSYVIGSTGPVWLDGDGNGVWRSAREYAAQCVHHSRGSMNVLVAELAAFDEATAAHAACLLSKDGISLLDDEVQQSLEHASVATRNGFRQYLEAWRESQAARAP